MLYIVFLCLVWESTAIIQGRFTRNIRDYQVIIPRKVKPNGAFDSFRLSHGYGEHLVRTRRSATQEDHVHYRLDIGGEQEVLRLEPHSRLTSPGMFIEQRHGPNISNIFIQQPSKHLCHYRGVVLGDNSSRLALSVCDGMTGIIMRGGKVYYLEPLEKSVGEDAQLHLIYSDPLKHTNARHSCTSEENWWDSWARQIYKQMSSDKQHRPVRSDPSQVVPRYIELCVVADLKFIEHHKSVNLEEYILTIMNVVSDFYHQESIGNLIDVVIVRIVYLHKEKEELDLDISSKAKQSLEKFCKWQINVNTKDANHPNHHDIAVLLTRHDICADEGSEGCGLLGLAYVGTACDLTQNCCINEDTGLTLAATVAHELGHNLGCAHDSLEESGCEGTLPDGTNTVMSPTVGAVTTVWSNCSKQFISSLIANFLGECLLDEPRETRNTGPPMLVGAVYDGDQQCKFIYGENVVRCNIGGNKICERLWCKRAGSQDCISQGQFVADGTPCGSNKWCYNKRCLEEGQRPEAVDGGWSSWASWTDCSRSCGAGVSMRQRVCTQPPPSHGGKYCIGGKIENKICNSQPCEGGIPTFRQQQCEQHNEKPFKGVKYTWSAHPPPESDPNQCALYCINKKKNIVKLEAWVKDGTRCTPGEKNTCIQGECIQVGCDWGIGSKAREDVCGVCDGDGAHCKLIKETYKLKKKTGYAKVVDIPKDSKNINIAELESSENMLAVGSLDHNIYFNNNYTEATTGEYLFGGAMGLYTKPEEGREEIHIKGPLRDEIRLYYVFFKEYNPGVTYSYALQTSQPTFNPSYHWEFTEWGPCSARCGGGTEISKATCVEAKRGKVKENLCELAAKPNPESRTCNAQKCPTRWKTWHWGPCSGCMYKTGERTRLVECVMDSPEVGDQIIVDERDCCGAKPPTKELCNSSKPCNSTETPSNTTRKKKRWLDIEDDEFIQHSYELAGVEGMVKRYFKRAVAHHQLGKHDKAPIVIDKVPLSKITVETVRLSDCYSDIRNMSETDFETLGDTLADCSVSKAKVLHGSQALKVLRMAISNSSKPLNNTHHRNLYRDKTILAYVTIHPQYTQHLTNKRYKSASTTIPP